MNKYKDEILKLKEVDTITNNTITLKEGYDEILKLKGFQENIKKITGEYPTPCDVNILDWYINEEVLKNEKNKN